MSIQQASPNPRDARDLARDAAINGGLDEDTLMDAWREVRQCKQQADGDNRELWDDAEQALLGAISRARRDGDQT